MLWENRLHLVRQKEFIAGTVLGAVLLGLFLLGPLLVPYDPRATSLEIFSPPDGAHWLGTNDVGQDIFSRLLTGGKNSLTVALGSGLITTLLAVFLGACAALAGARADKIIMRLVDILLVIPNIIMIVLISAYVRPSLVLEIIIISLLGWLEGARIIRIQVLTLKERTHVYAARIFGAKGCYVFGRHILPELVPILLSLLVQGMRRAVFIEAGLAFIGVVDPNVISWGSMISTALNFYYLCLSEYSQCSESGVAGDRSGCRTGLETWPGNEKTGLGTGPNHAEKGRPGSRSSEKISPPAQWRRTPAGTPGHGPNQRTGCFDPG